MGSYNDYFLFYPIHHQSDSGVLELDTSQIFQVVNHFVNFLLLIFCPHIRENFLVIGVQKSSQHPMLEVFFHLYEIMREAEEQPENTLWVIFGSGPLLNYLDLFLRGGLEL